jgi:hypothetical protein
MLWSLCGLLAMRARVQQLPRDAASTPRCSEHPCSGMQRAPVQRAPLGSSGEQSTLRSTTSNAAVRRGAAAAHRAGGVGQDARRLVAPARAAAPRPLPVTIQRRERLWRRMVTGRGAAGVCGGVSASGLRRTPPHRPPRPRMHVHDKRAASPFTPTEAASCPPSRLPRPCRPATLSHAVQPPGRRPAGDWRRTAAQSSALRVAAQPRRAHSARICVRPHRATPPPLSSARRHPRPHMQC